jgi:hypothetical protein
VLIHSVKLNKMLSILLAGGLLLGSLSMAIFPASAGPTETPPSPLVPDLTNPIYMPFMAKSISDLYISNVEITQAVQNISTPVSLVAGRPAEARVYTRSSGSTPVGNLYASLVAYRNGVRLGKLIAGPGTAYVQSDSLDSLRCSDNVNETCTSYKTFNFKLPANWTAAGDLTLAANIDIYNTAPELSEVNTTTLQYTFNTVPALNVMVVPINYVAITPRGTYTYPAADTSYLKEGLFRMYPVPQVNVTAHSPITFQGSLSSNDMDWDALLNQVDALKQSEGQPDSTVYFGMIPLMDATGQNSWFDCQSGGVVGYGFVGYRASIAVTKAVVCGNWDLHGDDFAAHEIGHNLGMEHTPCGNPDSPDPNYPYPAGNIGQYGYYVNAQTVMDKERPDIMSYCENEWVSDYTYQHWLNNQMSTLAEVALPSQDSVFVRADLASDGTAKLQPVYNFSASLSSLPASSDYLIQFLDAQGNLVNEYPVIVKRAEEHGHIIQTISARLPRPSQPYSSIRAVHNGQAMDTRPVSSQAMLAPLAAPTVRVDASDLVLNWASTASPALVRFTSDGGQTWTTVGVDVAGGEFRVAVADLPAMPLQFQVIPADGTATLTVDWTP